ncbi:hypothetical protein [Allorhodopirellula heiligendammensis]|uniref:Uncharacterized protein n=1 Tax=Allorhodopirellula heiligendammensis TaxID=2714739 RepID=A0A5C6BAB2_9BACT|nr:hypothetical protein [Allorhodopirellula heiligendammensis]TWU08582.1 hypothetical protein Poly21_55510 [Allorhodopirellula heiligendammensis]
MTSLTLEGATGARLGRVRVADSSSTHDIYTTGPNYALRNPVEISEQQLRDLFASLRSFWPPTDVTILDAIRGGTYRPKRGLPDIGFQLTGYVNFDEGFVVSWDAGTIRGTANGCLLLLEMDPSIVGYDKLRYAIDCIVDRTSASK